MCFLRVEITHNKHKHSKTSTTTHTLPHLHTHTSTHIQLAQIEIHTNASTRKIHSNRASEPTSAHHQHARIGEAQLSWHAHAWQDHLPAVSSFSPNQERTKKKGQRQTSRGQRRENTQAKTAGGGLLSFHTQTNFIVAQRRCVLFHLPLLPIQIAREWSFPIRKGMAVLPFVAVFFFFFQPRSVVAQQQSDTHLNFTQTQTVKQET